jgi:hypothetical protein
MRRLEMRCMEEEEEGQVCDVRDLPGAVIIRQDENEVITTQEEMPSGRTQVRFGIISLVIL